MGLEGSVLGLERRIWGAHHPVGYARKPQRFYMGMEQLDLSLLAETVFNRRDNKPSPSLKWKS